MPVVIFVTDHSNFTVRKITPGGVVTTFAGGLGSGSADGTGIGAFLGNLTGVVSTLAGTGVPGANDGPGASAFFSNPIGLALNGNGNIYVSEGMAILVTSGGTYRGNNKVRKIIPDVL
jgi:hypothetical protein